MRAERGRHPGHARGRRRPDVRSGQPRCRPGGSRLDHVAAPGVGYRNPGRSTVRCSTAASRRSVDGYLRAMYAEELLAPWLAVLRDRLRLVLAHCAAGMFDGVWPRIDDYPNVLFDTSWWNPATIAALLRLSPRPHPVRQRHPVRRPTQQPVQTLRLALQVGLADGQIQGIMGGQARCVLARQDLLDLGPRPAPERRRWRPRSNACTSCSSPSASACSAVTTAARSCSWRSTAARPARTDRTAPSCSPWADCSSRSRGGPTRPLRQARTPGFDLALVAATVARTPDAPVPALGR